MLFWHGFAYESARLTRWAWRTRDTRGHIYHLWKHANHSIISAQVSPPKNLNSVSAFSPWSDSKALHLSGFVPIHWQSMLFAYQRSQFLVLDWNDHHWQVNKCQIHMCALTNPSRARGRIFHRDVEIKNYFQQAKSSFPVSQTNPLLACSSNDHFSGWAAYSRSHGI